jgi:hypothetical protein
MAQSKRSDGARASKDYTEHFRKLARGYLGGPLRAEESMSEEKVHEAERRLGLTLPNALRAYYLVAGNCKTLNLRHDRLYAPENLEVDGDYLMFMDENQSVVSWGLRLSDLDEPDPIVWQRNNVEPPEFSSEKKSFTLFMKSLFAFYRGPGGGALTDEDAG